MNIESLIAAAKNQAYESFGRKITDKCFIDILVFTGSQQAIIFIVNLGKYGQKRNTNYVNLLVSESRFWPYSQPKKNANELDIIVPALDLRGRFLSGNKDFVNPPEVLKVLFWHNEKKELNANPFIG